MQRFYLPSADFIGDFIESDDKEFVSQLNKVLRAKHGDKFEFFDDSGDAMLSQLTDLERGRARFLIIDRRKGKAEPDIRVTLYQSLVKKDKFDWIVQKTVELGAAKIVPVISEHSIVRELSEAKLARYEEIIKEATEQCGGVRLAEICRPMKYSAAIKLAAAGRGTKLIAYEKETANDLRDIEASEIHLFVGPEGGYSESEISEALAANVAPISLGKRILRAETAAIVALARLL